VLALLSLLSSGGSRENAAISSLGASLVVVVVVWCYGFGHQARALLMFVISVVALGIKLGLMEFVSLRYCSESS
jgi:predicted RND superfamily exporter protein